MRKADSRFSQQVKEENNTIIIKAVLKPKLRSQLTPLQVSRSPPLQSVESVEKQQSQLASRGFIDIGTPSTQINQSQFSSRQSNIRGFFLKEQISREEVWRQTEFKRKTKENLDQQIEEKKSLPQNNMREQKIQQYQDLNIQKISSLLDKSPKNFITQNSPSPFTPTTANYDTLSVGSYEQSLQNRLNQLKTSESRTNFNKDDEQSKNFDSSEIQNILKENQILKHRLSQKQVMIEGLIRQKKDNLRQQALQDIQENYMRNSKLQSSQRRLNFIPTITKQNIDTNSVPRIPIRILKKPTFLMKKSVPSVVTSHVSTQQSFNFYQNSTVQNEISDTNTQPRGSYPIMKSDNSINNFTFSNNLVEQLKTSAQNYQSKKQNLNSRLLKEFPQDNLRRKFCI